MNIELWDGLAGRMQSLLILDPGGSSLDLELVWSEIKQSMIIGKQEK